MTLTTVALGGTDIESLGLVLADASGLHAVPKRTFPTVAIKGKPGRTVVSTKPDVDIRLVPFNFQVSPTSFTDRTTKLRAITALFPGLVSLTCVDDPNVVLKGRLQDMAVTTPFKLFATPAVYAGPTLVCHDPLWYDSSAVTQTISAGVNGSISMGDADLRRMTIGIAGPVTNPIVILKDQTTAELARNTLTGQLFDTSTATALQPVSLSIDCDAYTITGTRKNATTFDALSWLGATETFFELVLSEIVTAFTLSCSGAALSVSHYRAYWTP